MTAAIGQDGLPELPAAELAQTPVAVLDDLRRSTPIVRTHPRRVMALRGEDVERLVNDPRLVQLPGAQFADVMGIPPGRCRSFLEDFMLLSNGAEHQASPSTFSISAPRGCRRK